MMVARRWLLVFLLATINFTHIVDSMLIMPLGDLFIETFDISPSQYTFLVSGYALAAFFSGLAAVFYLDRVDRKIGLLFIYAGFSVGTFACGLADSYVTLLTLRIVTGLFGGIIGAMVLSVISDLFAFHERGKAMGYLFAAFSAASALGVPIGIYVADLASWQLPFLTLGILGLIICGIIYLTFPKLNEHLQYQDKKLKIADTLGKIFEDRNQVNALSAGFVLVLAHFMIIPFISPYLIKNVGLTQREIAFQFFLGGAATLISSPIVGKMTDKKGVMPVFTTMMLVSFIPTLLITNLPQCPLWVALTSTTLFFVFASGRMISPNTIITAAAPQSNRGSFMSLKSSLQQLAIGLAGLISGAIVYVGEDQVYHNYQYVGLLSILLGVISLYFVKVIKVAPGN